MRRERKQSPETFYIHYKVVRKTVTTNPRLINFISLGYISVLSYCKEKWKETQYC